MEKTALCPNSSSSSPVWLLCIVGTVKYLLDLQEKVEAVTVFYSSSTMKHHSPFFRAHYIWPDGNLNIFQKRQLETSQQQGLNWILPVQGWGENITSFIPSAVSYEVQFYSRGEPVEWHQPFLHYWPSLIATRGWRRPSERAMSTSHTLSCTYSAFALSTARGLKKNKSV